MFSICLFVHTRWQGTPVPGSFPDVWSKVLSLWGGYQSHSGGGGGGYSSSRFFGRSLVQGPFPGGTPVQAGGGTVSLSWSGYPFGQDRVTSQPGLGYLLVRTEVPPGQDWSNPWWGLGYPLDRLPCGQYASCGFPLEDFLVYLLNSC